MAPRLRIPVLLGGLWAAALVAGAAGQADTLPLVVKHDWSGAQPGDDFGLVVTAAGDFDGDGRADVAISAPAGGEQGRGLVLVFSGADGRMLTRLTGPAEEGQFGKGLSAGRDLDGDGVPDLLVGAPGLRPGGPSSGAALLISGRTTKVLRSVNGEERYEFLGGTVVLAPDLDGDGKGDLLIGAHQDRDASDTIVGSVRAVGSVGGEVAWLRFGGADKDTYGYAFDVVGDLDGDGVVDLAAGALGNDVAGPDAGQVQILSGRDGSVLHDLWGAAGADRFGTAVAGLGDLDGDGFGDLAVGAPGHDAGGDSAGTVFVHSGRDLSLLFSVSGRSPGDELGNLVAAAGDVDGDGVPDLLASALQDYNGGPGYALLLSGRDGALLGELRGDDDNRNTGFALAGVGDVDGDGRAEVAVATGFSRQEGRAVGRVRVLGVAPGGGR